MFHLTRLTTLPTTELIWSSLGLKSSNLGYFDPLIYNQFVLLATKIVYEIRVICILTIGQRDWKAQSFRSEILGILTNGWRNNGALQVCADMCDQWTETSLSIKFNLAQHCSFCVKSFSGYISGFSISNCISLSASTRVRFDILYNWY